MVDRLVVESAKLAADSHMALLVVLLGLTVFLYYKAVTDQGMPDKFKTLAAWALVATFFVLLSAFLAKGCEQDPYAPKHAPGHPSANQGNHNQERQQ